MDLTRRSFFRGALALTALAATPALSKISFAPMIYGDGVRDDTDGLQALLSGQPFQVAEDAVGHFFSDAMDVQIIGGRHRTTRPLFARGFKGTIHIRDTIFITDNPTARFRDVWQRDEFHALSDRPSLLSVSDLKCVSLGQSGG